LVTGNAKREIQNQIVLSPNPVTSELRIKNAELRIEKIKIYDAFGELILVQTGTRNQEPVTIDTSQLPSGIYFVRVKTDKGISVAKFVKE
jgi:hypothetical protein